MALNIGIVGLPNVGKSTIMNALTATQVAAAENYPFCTIEANKASVPVPDPRLDRIASLTSPEKVTPTSIMFIDIAGLVRNASKGEGRGNAFLANVAECDALLHVVRCFHDSQVVHVEGELSPKRDIETIETELILRDLQVVDKRLAKLTKQAQAEKALRPQLAIVEALAVHLNRAQPASSFPDLDRDDVQVVLQDLQLTTDKSVIFCANADDEATASAAAVEEVRECAAARGAPVVVISARMEAEVSEMPPAERCEFLEMYGVEQGALKRLVRLGYAGLGLISFFTIQSEQVQAWTIPQGTPAPRAAGKIHSDFEQGFIRAEVMAFKDLCNYGSESACREAGVVRTEGKEYVVQDGDIIRFLFSS